MTVKQHDITTIKDSKEKFEHKIKEPIKELKIKFAEINFSGKYCIDKYHARFPKITEIRVSFFSF